MSQQVASKHVTASQYTDETGNPCLKLRVSDETEKTNEVPEIAVNQSFTKNKIIKEEINGNVHCSYNKDFISLIYFNALQIIIY